MLKRKAILFSILCLFFTSFAWADGEPVLSITGEVKHPLTLNIDDLSRLGRAHVRLNEFVEGKSFNGVFEYEGPSLRTLLEVAQVEKSNSEFSKCIDLAIRVRNKQGDEAVLSWGEVIYRNPADVIIATKASPVMPFAKCDMCHKPEESKPWFEPLVRTVGLPKLVIADDFYTDRCLEEITSIEVVNLRPQLASTKMKKLYSPGFVVSGKVKKNMTMSNLGSFARKEIMAKQAGDGKGFHGLKTFGGLSLRKILESAEIEPNPCSAILISAPDGYRSLFSYGELFLSSSGDDAIVADMLDGQPMEKNGKFCMITPIDLAADRWVKAVNKIEVFDLRRESKLYVIGIGCGGADLITLEAISCLAKADAIVCSSDLKERFAQYLGDKPVLFDPIESLEKLFHNGDPDLPHEERKIMLGEQRDLEAHKVIQALEEGKSVAYLDYGDPMIYGSWRFLGDYMDADSFEFVPGISSFNAASALLKRDITCNGSIVITAPQDLEEKETLVQTIAESGDTLAIFMGLKHLQRLMPLFQKYYEDDTSVSLVYEAGIPGKERVIRTTLVDCSAMAEKEKEKWLGLIYIGNCLAENDKGNIR